MSVGDGSIESFNSYMAVGRETAFGTYNTAAAALPFISSSMKTMKEGKTIEQIETSRTYSKRIGLGRVVEGEIEGYAYAESLAFNYLLQNAFGGTVTSATATGETAGGLAFTHTFNIGSMDQSYTSLCLNNRKGDSAAGFVYEYNGVRVNELNFTSEIDEALKFTASVICKDSSLTANDVSAVLGVDTNEPLSFVRGRVSVEDSIGAATSTSIWHVQSVEFGIGNNLKSDTPSRRIGSDTLDVLPVGIATFPITLNMRFDTSTAYAAMLNETQKAVELEFLGDTLTGSVIRRGVKFKYPKVFISDAGDPEIGGPDEILTAAVVLQVLRDDSSATGYALQAEVTNLTSSLA